MIHVHAGEDTHLVELLRPDVTSVVTVSLILTVLSFTQDLDHNHEGMLLSATSGRGLDSPRETFSVVLANILSKRLDALLDERAAFTYLSGLSDLTLIHAVFGSRES